MRLKVSVHIEGFIDVPEQWDEPDNPQMVLDVTEFRYTEQLTEEDAISELSALLCKYAEEADIELEVSREVK